MAVQRQLDDLLTDLDDLLAPPFSEQLEHLEVDLAVNRGPELCVGEELTKGHRLVDRQELDDRFEKLRLPLEPLEQIADAVGGPDGPLRRVENLLLEPIDVLAGVELLGQPALVGRSQQRDAPDLAQVHAHGVVDEFGALHLLGGLLRLRLDGGDRPLGRLFLSDIRSHRQPLDGGGDSDRGQSDAVRSNSGHSLCCFAFDGLRGAF